MIYTLSNEYLKVAISSLGAEIQSVIDLETGRENMWHGDPDVWAGRSPVLFPIVGRLKKDQFEYDGKIYPMKQHGFARRREFVARDVSDAAIAFVLEYDEDTIAAYPFKFRLSMHYRLEGRKLSLMYRVENVDDKRMYYSIGAHPGFICEPGDTIHFSERETLESLRLEAGTHLVLPNTMPVLNDEDTITLTEHTFDDDSLIFRGFKSRVISLRRRDGSGVSVDLGDSTCFALWSKPKMGLRYVCIEPWLGVDDARDTSGRIEDKLLVENLDVGGIREFEIAFTFEA